MSTNASTSHTLHGSASLPSSREVKILLALIVSFAILDFLAQQSLWPRIAIAFLAAWSLSRGAWLAWKTPARLSATPTSHSLSHSTSLPVTPTMAVGDAQNEMRRARDVADAANRAKSAFLANVSHEIRTPLSAMMGFTEILLEGHASVADQRASLLTIKRNGEQLARIIDELLDFSKVEAGKLEMVRRPVDLRALLNELQAELAPRAHGKNLELELAQDPALPARLVTDPARLRQILRIVVGNAIKFTHRGSVRIQANAPREENGGQRSTVEFIVSDTGRGISDAQRPHLFDPFYQGDSSLSGTEGGSGLGLSLARRLARALGGEVELQSSTPGGGSVFRVAVTSSKLDDTIWQNEVTIAKAAAATPAEMFAPPIATTPMAAKTDQVIREAPPLAGLQVMLAEDSPDNQFVISRFLKIGGAAEVVVAKDGLEAFARASERSFDVILMDIQMPGLDGYEVTRRLRARGYSSPIVALTAHAMPEERARSIDAGCNDHLTKPLARQLLIEKLRVYVNRDKAMLGPQDFRGVTAG